MPLLTRPPLLSRDPQHDNAPPFKNLLSVTTLQVCAQEQQTLPCLTAPIPRSPPGAQKHWVAGRPPRKCLVCSSGREVLPAFVTWSPRAGPTQRSGLFHTALQGKDTSAPHLGQPIVLALFVQRQRACLGSLVMN